MSGGVVLGVLVAVCAAWGWFDIDTRLDPHTGEVIREDDYQVYREAARALLANEPLYQAANVRNWPYLYPPLLALLVAPLTYLPPRAELYAWFLVNLAMAVFCFGFMRSVARSLVDRPERRLPVWSGLLALFPIIETLHRGQANLVMFGFIASGLWMLSRSRAGSAGFLWAGASAIKVTPLLIGVWLLWKPALGIARDHRAVGPPLTAAAGYALGLIFWWYAVPACFIGAKRTHGVLTEFGRATVAELRGASDGASATGERTAAMLFKKSNQSWFHLFARIVGRKHYPVAAPVRFAWAAWLVVLLVGLFALSRARWNPPACLPRLITEFAGFLLVGVTAGKLAWNHTFLLAWPVLMMAEFAMFASAARRRLRDIAGPACAVAFALIWIAQMTAPGQVGAAFPLLITTTIVAYATLLRIGAPAGRRRTAGPVPPGSAGETP